MNNNYAVVRSGRERIAEQAAQSTGASVRDVNTLKAKYAASARSRYERSAHHSYIHTCRLYDYTDTITFSSAAARSQCRLATCFRSPPTYRLRLDQVNCLFSFSTIGRLSLFERSFNRRPIRLITRHSFIAHHRSRKLIVVGCGRVCVGVSVGVCMCMCMCMCMYLCICIYGSVSREWERELNVPRQLIFFLVESKSKSKSLSSSLARGQCQSPFLDFNLAPFVIANLNDVSVDHNSVVS